ncbi:MAG: polysaccharide deacetylase family protein [Roseiflexaceae bacterium]
MFFDLDIKADRLPPKTVCLTYDDGPGETNGPGPGPRTRALGCYLFEQGIPATFFVLGRHVAAYPGLPRELRAWGHLVGNHTYSHPGLVQLARAGGDVAGEIARTDALIRQAVASPVTFLRAPYGNWREKVSSASSIDKPTSIVADILNRSGRFSHYVGPINWDISSLDWEFWGRGDSAEQCAMACLERVERIGRGIILMHDSSEDAAIRANNRTAEATQLLVAALKARGYCFIRLDAIPQVRSATRVSALIQLRSAEGRVILRAADDAICLGAPAEDAAAREETFGVEVLGEQRIALRTSNGQYLSVEEGREGRIRAGPLAAGATEVLQIEQRGDRQIALRTPYGCYLTRGPDDLLRADTTDARVAETFVIHRRA